MYRDLLTIFGHSPTDLPAKRLFSIEEIFPASASFLIPHFASLFLKGNCNVVLVVAANTPSHYSTVAAKLGVIFEPRSSQKKQFQCLEARVLLSNCSDAQDIPDKLLVDIESLFESFTDPSQPICLIFDSLAFLLDLGVGLKGLRLFIRKCRKAIFDRSGIVCAVTENDASSDAHLCDYDLMSEVVAYLSDYRLVVSPFGAGFSKDVSGKLDVFHSANDLSLVPKMNTLHYRLGERSVKFMAPGRDSANLYFD